MSGLPFDCCRCSGVLEDGEDTLVSPCNTCRRVLWAEPSGPRSPWFVDPPLYDGRCDSHWPTEETK